MSAAFGTDIGRKRTKNQDNGIALPDIGLFIVADGMGGHLGGETASSMVVDIVPDLIKKAQKSKKFDPRQALVDAITEANEKIYDRSLKQSELHGMGTTTTILLFHEETMTIGHVGDSRAYLLDKESVWQLTRDHSLVQEKLRAGLITREQLKTDRLKNVITRSVGFEPAINVELYEWKPQSGNLFLICSDGLTGMLDDQQMFEIVKWHAFERGGDLKSAVEALIQAANDKGGDDNITAVLVSVEE